MDVLMKQCAISTKISIHFHWFTLPHQSVQELYPVSKSNEIQHETKISFHGRWLHSLYTYFVMPVSNNIILFYFIFFYFLLLSLCWLLGSITSSSQDNSRKFLLYFLSYRITTLFTCIAVFFFISVCLHFILHCYTLSLPSSFLLFFLSTSVTLQLV